jgi:hypothetical protein
MLVARHFRTVLLVIGLLDFTGSSLLAAYSFSLANQYALIVEFSQFSRLGVNPFRLMAYRYGVLTVLFFLYVITYKLKNRWQFFIALPLIILMAIFALLIISDSGFLPQLGSASALFMFFLRVGGFVFLGSSILILVLNCATVWTTGKKSLA